MLSEKNFINPIEFFDAFEQMTKVLADTLEKYQKKERQDENMLEVKNKECTECICDEEDTCCCDNKCVCDYTSFKEPGQDKPINHKDVCSYKNTITDYTVTDYDNAIAIMKPVLDELVFDMRTFKYTDATLTFEFLDYTYKFYWDAELDRFIGSEYSHETLVSVYWDEIAGEIKDYDREVLKKQTETQTGPTDVNKEKEVTALKENILEAKKTITGRDIFNKVNNFNINKNVIFDKVLEQINIILQNDLYECCEKDIFGYVYGIRFSLVMVFKDCLEKLDEFMQHIDINELAIVIRDKFDFKEVFIDVDKKAVICYLV